MALPPEWIEENFKNIQKCQLDGGVISEKITNKNECFIYWEVFVKNVNSHIFRVHFSEVNSKCTTDGFMRNFSQWYFTEKNQKKFSEIVDSEKWDIPLYYEISDEMKKQIPECNLENFWKFSVKIEDVPARNFFKNENILYISIFIIFIFVVIFLLYKKFFKK